jgi:hypothetical protein
MNVYVTVCGPLTEESVSHLELSGDLFEFPSRNERLSDRWQADGAAGGNGARNCEGLAKVVIPTGHTPHGDSSEDNMVNCRSPAPLIQIKIVLFLSTQYCFQQMRAAV